VVLSGHRGAVIRFEEDLASAGKRWAWLDRMSTYCRRLIRGEFGRSRCSHVSRLRTAAKMALNI
jgi:hypothetical protein